MEQKNKQTVYFLNDNQWFKNELDMKTLYTEVHSGAEKYGSSANKLVKEMIANLLDLARMGRVDLSKPFIITDYGCGQSKAANVLAHVISETGIILMDLLNSGYNYASILEYLEANNQAADSIEITDLDQVMTYGHVTVQRFDIGIPKFSTPLNLKADVVFCNDVFEHIPYEDIPAFVADLENAGEYVVASISLRDAVNYSRLSKEILLNGAVAIDEEPTSGIILTEEGDDAYIFSLHVTIMPQDKWQEMLGTCWTLLPAQDYTACSAMNFEPSQEYQSFKRTLISQIGFADFIPFPTIAGTRYETDLTLFQRTAQMQPQKHVYKLNALESYPDSEFKAIETAKSMEFLKFVGASIRKNAETGLWEIEHLPFFIAKLYALDKLSKLGTVTADEIIAEYNSGNTKRIDNYIKNC